jgi:ABC-2 type transport system permease protein
VVEAERVLFAGDVLDAAVLQGTLAAAATCVLGLVVGIRVMRSGTAG